MAPTYDYECEGGHEFEEVQSIHDEPLIKCPMVRGGFPCGAPVKRLLCPTAFILKGAGWEKDGYSSTGRKKK